MIFILILLQQGVLNTTIAQNHFLNFDGIDNYIQVANNSHIDFSTDFTLEIKFKRERLNIREDLLTKKDLNNSSATASKNDVAFFLTADNKVNVLLREIPSNELLLTSTNSIDTTNWIHIACVRTFSTVEFYINGNLESSGTINADLSSDGPLRIGSNKIESFDPNAMVSLPFDGNIDEVRIWNIGRTSVEIIDNLNSELIGNEAGLSAYYNFNQGVPCSNNTLIDTLMDKTANNNLGTLTNFDLTGILSDPCESNWNGSQSTSILEIKTDLTRLYPNPVNNQLTIDFDTDKYVEEIKLYNITGELIKKEKIERIISNHQLDLSDIQIGHYLLVISDKKLNHVSYRILKQ